MEYLNINKYVLEISSRRRRGELPSDDRERGPPPWLERRKSIFKERERDGRGVKRDKERGSILHRERAYPDVCYLVELVPVLLPLLLPLDAS